MTARTSHALEEKALRKQRTHESHVRADGMSTDTRCPWAKRRGQKANPAAALSDARGPALSHKKSTMRATMADIMRHAPILTAERSPTCSS